MRGTSTKLAAIRHSAAISRSNARHNSEIAALKAKLSGLRSGVKEASSSALWQFAGGTLTGAFVGTVGPLVAFKAKPGEGDKDRLSRRRKQRWSRLALGLLLGVGGIYWKQFFAVGSAAGVIASEMGISGVEAVIRFFPGEDEFAIAAGQRAVGGLTHRTPQPAVGQMGNDVIPIVP